jgi:3-deoxy-manno-octulosonate cytidylyltransferase (CMP-KDO synthetase)
METAIAIPARLASSRFPKKVLANLYGKPVIQWVYEAACRAHIGPVHILVDSAEVEKAARSFCDNVTMTSPDCCCGTARIASVLTRIGGDFIVNVQGDEPLLNYQTLVTLNEHAKISKADIVTPIFRITDASDVGNPALVKVAVCGNGRALYFSRSPIPFVRGVDRDKWLENYPLFGHIGVYGFRRAVLENYGNLRESTLESAESLEQLRFLDNGYTIDTVIADGPTVGIDIPADMQRAMEHIGISQRAKSPG